MPMFSIAHKYQDFLTSEFLTEACDLVTPKDTLFVILKYCVSGIKNTPILQFLTDA